MLKSDLDVIWPVSVNSTGDDFALLVEELNGPTYLVHCDAIEQWDQSRHAFIPPVFVGDGLVAVEVGEQHERYVVRQEGKMVYDFTALVAPGLRADNPVKGLWSWNGRWCEPAAFNVFGNEVMVWFHALRGGMWYYVKMGIYGEDQG